MSTSDYLNLFFPFDKSDVAKRGIESVWNVKNDRVMAALAMAMSDKPMAVNMSFQREYAERYEWIKRQFTDLVFTYFTSMLYYEDYDKTSPEERLLLQQGMKAFMANDSSTEFCSTQCENAYKNMKKSRN